MELSRPSGSGLSRRSSARQERRPDSRYASAQQCAFEVRAAEQLFERHGIPFGDTAKVREPFASEPGEIHVVA